MPRGAFWVMLTAAAVLLATAGCGASASDPVADREVVSQLRQGGGGSGDGGGAAASTATGWGTFKGRFVLSGSAPATKPTPTGGKDAGTCGTDSPDHTFMTGDGGGIANIAVFARKVSRVHESFGELTKEPAIFDQKACAFLSQVKPLYVGQTVVVKNSDPVAHNTAGSPPSDKAFNFLLAPNSQAEVVLKKAQNEPFAVTCSVHAWMKAYMLPRKDPYLAVTKPDGTFEIANVPAGASVEFQFWHERGAAGGALSAGSINAQGRLKIKIPADGETFDLGTIEVKASAFK